MFNYYDCYHCGLRWSSWADKERKEDCPGCFNKGFEPYRSVSAEERLQQIEQLAQEIIGAIEREDEKNLIAKNFNRLHKMVEQYCGGL